MSASTRWWRGSALAVVLAATVAAAPASANHRPVAAPPLPPAVAALVPGVHAMGGGELKVLGLSIYDGWYWGDDHRWQPERPFALDLHYHRDIAGARIVERSVAEIEKQGRGTADDRRRWAAALRRILPDVVKGDRITGLSLAPGIVRYFLNGRPIGDIDDADFARAFFGIWLDPKSSRADFRHQLLGDAP
jgi:hypothetical protein